MTNQVKIGLLILGGILVLGLFAWLLFQPTRRDEAEKTARAFTLAFATYERGNPEDYEQRLTPFLAENTKEAFLSKYSVEGFEGAARNGYQKDAVITNADVRQLSSETALVAVTYEVTKTDPPQRPEPFAVTATVAVTLQKQGEGWKVSAVGFE